jgi:hypothetical protein
MSNWTTQAEKQQLLPKESGLSSQQQQEEDVSMAHIGEERNESSMRSFLVAPLALVAVGLVVWLAFTGFVVAPPGDLTVVVTLVSNTSYEFLRVICYCSSYLRLSHAGTRECLPLVYLPGPHFRTPFVSTVHPMSTKTQLISEKNNIPTKEGERRHDI